MIDQSLKVACRPNLLVFVDAVGQTIFEKLAEIKKQIELDDLIQQYTAVIFYSSKFRKSLTGSLNESVSFDKPDTYQLVLEDAIAAQLDMFLKNETIEQELISNGYDVHTGPHIFIIGNYQMAAPGMVLKVVHKVLSRYAQTLPGVRISYVLTGRPTLLHAPTRLTQTAGTVASTTQVEFCYVYCHTTSLENQQEAFFAAASALLLLISVDISGQQKFQEAIQHSEQRCGSLSICFLTFPGQELREYSIKNLAADLLNKWIKENSVVVTQPDLEDLSDSQSLSFSDLVWIKGMSQKRAVEIVQEWEIKKPQLGATLNRHLTQKSINAYSKKLHRQSKRAQSLEQTAHTDVLWLAALAQKVQEVQEEWQKRVEEQAAKVRVERWIKEDIHRILREHKEIPHLVLVRTYLDLVQEQCEQLLSPRSEKANTQSKNTDPAGKHLKETSGQISSDTQKVRVHLEILLKNKLSFSTSLTALILTLCVISFLLLTGFLPFAENFVTVAYIVVVASFLILFCWQQWRIARQQKQLLVLTYQEILPEAEKIWRDEQSKCIAELHKNASLRLENLHVWLSSWQRQLPSQADKKLAELLNMLKASPYFHFCNGNLLLKQNSDKNTIQAYYQWVVYLRMKAVESALIQNGEDGNGHATDSQETIQEIRSSLYKQLFDLPEEQKILTGLEEEQLSNSLEEKLLSDPLGHMIDKHFWDTSEARRSTGTTELTLVSHNPEIWRDLFGSLLRPSPLKSNHSVLALVCNRNPETPSLSEFVESADTPSISESIQRCTNLKESEILLMRIKNESWLFVATLFEENITHFFHPNLFSYQESPILPHEQFIPREI